MGLTQAEKIAEQARENERQNLVIKNLKEELRSMQLIFKRGRKVVLAVQWWCRKLSWVFFILCFLVIMADVIMGALGGTELWSFSYSHGFGFGQLIALLVCGSFGLILMILGKAK